MALRLDRPRQKGRNGTVFRYRRRESYHETQLEGARRVTSSRRWKDGQIYYPDARVLLQRGNVNADRRSFQMYIEYDWGEGGVEIRGYDYSCLTGKFILSFALLEDRISTFYYVLFMLRICWNEPFQFPGGTETFTVRRKKSFGKIVVLYGKIHSEVGFKKQIY